MTDPSYTGLELKKDSSPPKTFITREEYLLEASHLLMQGIQLRCEKRGITAFKPNPLRVSVGFPAGTRGNRKGKPVAECWPMDMVGDGIPAIFISPSLVESEVVLANLAHEVVHVMVGSEHGHRRGSDFDHLARLADLQGPLTSTHPGKELTAFIKYLIEYHLGRYEALHSAVISTKVPEKGRLLKAHCSLCGFTARVSRLWAEKIDHKCPYPPLESSGGSSGAPPPPSDEIDLTPVKPPPSGGESGESGESKDKASEGGEASEENKEGDEKGSDESGAKSEPSDPHAALPGETDECGACEGPVRPDATTCRHCGALFVESAVEGDEIKGTKVGETIDLAPEKLNPKRHNPELCPFGTGCPECEGRF